jgi:hypothetical protein
MKTVSHRRAPRGQSLVELVLAMLVFVTVLMFGIHFAEIGYLSVKVTEASHSALLDTTGHKLHQWPLDTSDSRAAAQKAATEATARYKDFDSRTSTVHGDGLAQVFTRVSGMNVTCSTGSGPSFGPGLLTIGAYRDAGGLSCQSEALIEPVGAYTLPKKFMEGPKGFFSQPHLLRPDPFRVCGMGRAQGGACLGRLTMALDDWGLSGDAESGICPFIPDVPAPCPTNLPFYAMAGSVFVLNGLGQGISGSQMAMGIVKRMPLPFFYGGENMFWMSSAGEPLFVQPTGFSLAEGWPLWPTTPGAAPIGVPGLAYSLSYTMRDGCFLGRDCD